MNEADRLRRNTRVGQRRRSFVELEQWRALATRYDKRATIYRSAVVLAAIFVWLRVV